MDKGAPVKCNAFTTKFKTKEGYCLKAWFPCVLYGSLCELCGQKKCLSK